ncbi:hypothetical protein [uncultured Psychroserpens sp.]|uniref:hypothetical protein n=1 Tax=uncultured Psychroserpens sp. TaxID=255436 RepID=UPI00260D964B|nr:hypothetical protein [uncultured Psychroserpens sp.]
MIQRLLYILLFLVGLSLNAQQEFHVFPKDHKETPGTANGTGAIDDPWDLQTALKQKPKNVNAGDIIWLHEGIYNGKFVSTLRCLEPNKYITVSAYKNDKVVLNGNVSSNKRHVLEVRGQQVIYKNFDITCLGDFSRNGEDPDFVRINGLEHSIGEDCQFINLKIYNNPGLGVGSWKHTGGTIFNGCLIYNNGYMYRGKGVGEGVYTQNNSEKTRVFENCIIFNNYYKGIEVWSANKRAKVEYVKNYQLRSNVFFNNGSPAGRTKDNLIVASGDRNGINIAKNIKVLNNILYHNTNVANAQVAGDGASLTLGFHKNAPIENVTVKNNIIIGRNNGLRILHAKSLTFENNKVYCGYVHMQPSVLEHISKWKLKKNTYYTKNNTGFRILKHEDYDLKKWQSNFGLDGNSKSKNIEQFDMKTVRSLVRFKHRENAFKVVVLEKEGESVLVDFSKTGLAAGMVYTIYDVENLSSVLSTGTLSEDLKVTLPMQQTAFEKPLHNTKANKTLSNFGVFIVEFETQEIVEASTKKKDNAFKRFFKWLGF